MGRKPFEYYGLFLSFINFSLNFSQILDILGKLLSICFTAVSLYYFIKSEHRKIEESVRAKIEAEKKGK